MKIKEVLVHPISVPLEAPFYFSQGWVHQRSSVIVELVTDDGLHGWGESLCHGLQPPQIAAAFIENVFKPMLLGQDPFDVEVLWERMYNRTQPYGQGGSAVNAISGVDIALWDLIGRKLERPIHKLLGGAFRSDIQPYATGFYRVEGGSYPKDSVAEAKRHVAAGFSAMKLKIGFGVEQDVALIEAIRDAIGPDLRLMADANAAYTSSEARRLINATESANIYFFEELLAPEDMKGYQELKSYSRASIAAGEQLFGKQGYRPWLETRALDIIQPDLCSAGGFTECKKIAAIAQACHTRLIPHVWGSGIGLAASLQFLAALPALPLSLNPVEPLLEFDQSSHPFRTDLIFDAIKHQNGRVAIPSAPGIGVEINRDVLDKYRV